MRHLKEIYHLPVSELSDEEIVKVAVKRLNAQCAVLFYIDETGHGWFFGRYKNKFPGSSRMVTQLYRAWDKFIGTKMVRFQN